MPAMDKSSVRVQAVSAGEAALGIIEGDDRFRAFAVFERSLYAEDGEGRVFCLLHGDLELGPLHVLCGGWPGALRALVPEGTVFRRTGASLHSPGLAIDLSGAAPWRPAGYPAFDSARLRRGMAGLRESLPGFVPENSLVAAILLESAAPSGESDPVGRYLVEEVRRALADLAQWLCGVPGAPPGRMVNLLGLGPGLTPTGDDVIAGSLLALHALGRRTELSSLARALEPLIAEKTNRISAAHLDAALRGQGAAPFHDCIRSLMSGGDGLEGILPRIARVGHSSGWDALVGIVRTLGAVLLSIP